MPRAANPGPLVVVFGATGSVGSMLMPYLSREPDMTLTTCGRKPWSAQVMHYPWSFGARPPLEAIVAAHPGASGLIVIYSAISWPRDAQDIEANLGAFCSVVASLPAEGRLIEISSYVARTRSESAYAQ